MLEQTQEVLDRVNRIKGLLRSNTDAIPSPQIASRYPDPALLVPAQAAEIQDAYKVALEAPININRRPHRVLALVLYRLGYNPRNSFNAVPLAEWILRRYQQVHPKQTTVPL